jgi:M6 family metalloprotease-like protein
MVDFQMDNDPRTTGNGQFLNEPSEEYISYYDLDISKCSEFLIDPPPHNRAYFEDQIIAVKNYYSNISRGNTDIEFHIISDNPFSVDQSMVYYSELSDYDNPEEGIVRLFSDGLDKAQNTIEEYLDSESLLVNDVLFVMFHAGMGEDYGFSNYLDPANYDIRSAYIDNSMLSFIPEGSWMDQNNINKGILLPESLNLIYYDTIEDIYGNAGEDGLCDVQIGMTGLFTYLLGYEFGLPEMFDTQSGDSGVGVFGLMDVGSFNGRGVMPSPPQGWSRLEMGWEEAVADGTELYQRYSRFNTSNFPRRVNINQSEYYLLETVSNKIFLDYGIPDILYADSVGIFEIPESISSLFGRLLYIDEMNDEAPYNPNQSAAYYTDIISEDSECNLDSRITIDPDTGVILCLTNYDYGLPGSGMLIWHINESNQNNINNDINNRTVNLVEADGAQDIGFPNNAWPLDPSVGWKYDLWFDDNGGYYNANPNQQDINFNSYTQPSTNDSNGANSYIAIDEIKSGIMDDHYSIQFDLSIESDLFSQDLLIEPYSQPIEIFGAGVDNGDGYIITNQGIFRSNSSNSLDIDNEGFIILQDGDPSSCALDEYFDENCKSLDNYIPKGSFYDTDSLPEVFRNIQFYNLAMGDIDQDGVDEILESTDSQINCYNPNGTSCNGFPIFGNYHHNILIANILDKSHPQIISRADESIYIISHTGEIEHRISSEFSSDLYIVPEWSNKFGLVDGNRVLKFKEDKALGYWLNPNGRSNNQPIVNSDALYNELSSLEPGKIDIFYNYPNPVSDGTTRFRYFLGSDIDKIEIKIYSASGFLIKSLSSNQIQSDEYNEIAWIVDDIPLGLYLANLVSFSNSEKKDSKIIKVLIASKK